MWITNEKKRVKPFFNPVVGISNIYGSPVVTDVLASPGIYHPLKEEMNFHFNLKKLPPVLILVQMQVR